MSDVNDHKGDESYSNQWVKNTRLFRQWDEIKHEIKLHKWYESEKAGHDIGWDRATIDWMVRHGHKPE